MPMVGSVVALLLLVGLGAGGSVHAQQDALVVDENGRVGVNNLVLFRDRNGNRTEWMVRVARDGDLAISRQGTGGVELSLDRSGNLSIKGDLKVFSNQGGGSDFPDYVFRPDYVLTPLAEFKRYVAANGHLPGVPSAQRVAADGQGIAEVQRALLKTVEELTLHTLAQQQAIEDLQARLAALGVPGQPDPD